VLFNNAHFFRETQVVRSNRRLDPTALSARERLRRYGNPTPGQPAFVQENGQPTTVDEVREAYLQPGDFIRLRELSATYTLPSTLIARWGKLSSMSVGLALQNIALWTDYEGEDPEVIQAPNGDFNRTDFFTLPNPKRAILRVNLSF
jgi:hypothetical protein